MKKIRGKIAASVATVLLVAAAAICITVIAQVLSRGYASIGGYSTFRVVTGSMEPAVPVGTLLVAKRTDVEMVKEQDIICFRSKEPGILGEIITHRVVGVLQDENGNIFLRTKGDANLTEDGYYVTQDNLVGKVIWHTGDGSTMAAIFSIFTNKMGFLCIIVIPVLLVAALILRENIKSIRKELDKATRKLDENQEACTSVISEEEYTEMYERIKAELLEELKVNGTIGWDLAENKEAVDTDEGETAKETIVGETDELD